jgi:hypothetical protein
MFPCYLCVSTSSVEQIPLESRSTPNDAIMGSARRQPIPHRATIRTAPVANVFLYWKIADQQYRSGAIDVRDVFASTP